LHKRIKVAKDGARTGRGGEPTGTTSALRGRIEILLWTPSLEISESLKGRNTC